MAISLYNEDGSICKLRVGCLVVAAVCFFTSSLMQMSAADDIQDTKVEANLATQKQVTTQNFSKAKDLNQIIFTELSDAVAYLNTCGSINAGFVGCEVNFSDKFKQIYSQDIEAYDDGYTISITAQQKRDNICYKIIIDSSANVIAYNTKGEEITKQCVPHNFLKNPTGQGKSVSTTVANNARLGRTLVDN